MASQTRAGSSTRGRPPSDADEIRRALARELHDRVAQTLTTMLIELENFKLDQNGNQTVVKEVLGLQESTRDVLSNLRRVLYDLRGHAEADESFVDAVRALLVAFQEKTRMKAILSVAPSWPAKIGQFAAINILRIIEEALTNVRLHSGGSLVEVILGPVADGSVVIEVTDDGRGAENDVAARTPGLGVLGMRERAVILGGQVEVLAAATGGTTVRAIFPKEQLT